MKTAKYDRRFLHTFRPLVLFICFSFVLTSVPVSPVSADIPHETHTQPTNPTIPFDEFQALRTESLNNSNESPLTAPASVTIGQLFRYTLERVRDPNLEMADNPDIADRGIACENIWLEQCGQFILLRDANGNAKKTRMEWFYWKPDETLAQSLGKNYIYGNMSNEDKALMKTLIPKEAYAIEAWMKYFISEGVLSMDTTPPADTAPPIISNVQTSNITVNSAVITWATNEAATTQLEFGITTEYGSSTPLDAAFINNHQVQLTGLTRDTLYHYRLISRDAAGNAQTSQDFTFRTLRESLGDTPMNHHEEPIPDFVQSPTIVATGGNWADLASWNMGRIPSADDLVLIPQGVEIIVNNINTVADRIAVEGTLRFATNVDTQLRVSTLHVRSGGALIVGTQQDPVTANATIIIRDTPINLDLDPEQFGTGLLVDGRITTYGLEKTSFERLAAEPLAGMATLVFAAPVNGWKPGDTLVLADTRQLGEEELSYYGRNKSPQYETVTVQSVSADRLTVTLATPLQFSHLGARDAAGAVRYLPHVGNLSRNVRFASENPAGVRGHFQAIGLASVDVNYTEFYEFGRTTVAPLDSTTLGDDGSVTHIGTNQIGRYAVHMHHLASNAPPQSNGYQFNLIGLAVNGSPKWGVVAHDSHFGLVQNNAVYNARGAAFVQEDGSETGNTFDGNFAVRADGSGSPPGDDLRQKGAVDNGHEGSLFWFRGMNKTIITNNIAAGAQFAGIMVFQFNIRHTVRLPLFQGADTNNDSQVMVSKGGNAVQELGPAAFSNNEIYAVDRGIELWNPHVSGSVTIDHPVIWHASEFGVSTLYAMQPVHIIEPEIYFEPGKKKRGRITVGIMPVTHPGEDFDIQGGRIHGADEGIRLIPLRQSRVVGTELSNATNIVVRYNLTGKEPIVSLLEPVFRSGIRVEMRTLPHPYFPWRGISIGLQTTLLTLGGRQYRLYFYEQHPDYVVPQTTYSSKWKVLYVGSPEAGLTNRQNWDKYGIALGGGVAPDNAVELEGISGLAGPI